MADQHSGSGEDQSTEEELKGGIDALREELDRMMEADRESRLEVTANQVALQNLRAECAKLRAGPGPLIAASTSQGVAPAGDGTSTVKQEDLGATGPTAEWYRDAAAAMAKAMPRNREDVRRNLPVLKMGKEGTSLSDWEKQILLECNFRRFTTDDERISFALNHCEEAIHRHFEVTTTRQWSWADFHVILSAMIPKKTSFDTQNIRFLPRIQRLNRCKTHSWDTFVASRDFLAAFDELVNLPAQDITTFHRVSVLQALDRVAPAGAIKRYRDVDEKWKEAELDLVTDLTDFVSQAADWVHRHPNEDENFRKSLGGSAADTKGVHAVETKKEKKYCQEHGWCRHETSDCTGKTGGKPTKDGSGTKPGPKGRGRAPGTSTSSQQEGHGRGRGRGWRGRGGRAARGHVHGDQYFRGQNNRGRASGPAYTEPQYWDGWPAGQSYEEQRFQGCYVCGAMDHWAGQCPRRFQEIQHNQASKNDGGPGGPEPPGAAQ